MLKPTKNLLGPKSFRFLAIGLTLASLWLSLTPGDLDKIPSIPHLDKLVHFCSYGMLYACYWGGFFRDKTKRQLFQWAIFIALYSGVLEIIQAWMGLGRTGDIWDFVANCIGIFFVYFRVRRC